MSSAVEQIKSRLNIVDVVGSYIKLERSGGNFKARCPFHNEKTPSFYVSLDRESYHCFGCDKGGDMINFVEEIEGVDFLGALKILADKAGIKIEKEGSYGNSKKGRVFELLEEATDFYRKELIKNPSALEYLKNRGLCGETIKKFKIGYAPEGWRNIYDLLKKKKYADEEMEAAGMVIKSEKGYYDRFRGRIMFPIFSGSGNVIGFSGRILIKQNTSSNDKDQAKYINSPQTIVYDKSNVLYGINYAKVPIRSKGKCILVEGQMDLIMSHQVGIENAVAVSGTALTEEHLNQISKLADNITMAFDGDSAGLKASERAINSALKLGMEVKLARLPEGLDPADIIKNKKEDWEMIVDGSKHIVDFFLESDKSKNLSIYYTASIKSKIEQAKFVNKISEVLKINEVAVWDELKRLSRNEEAVDSTTNKHTLKNKKDERIERLKNDLTCFIVWQSTNAKNQNISEKYRLELVALIGEKEFNELKNTNSSNDRILEIEIAYSGVSDPGKEMKELLIDLKEEILRKRREIFWEKIKNLEKINDKTETEKFLKEFEKLSRELDLIKKEKLNLKNEKNNKKN